MNKLLFFHMRYLATFLISIAAFACIPTKNSMVDSDPQELAVESFKYPLKGMLGSKFNDSILIIGGFGSDMFPHPQLEDAFYLLTDRGPNYEWQTKNGAEAKGFAQPDYVPQIGLFQKQGSSFQLTKTILLKGMDGKPITGLPNLPGKGGTNEAAFDKAGNILQNDPNGLDPEGLVAMENGDFWVSDEYGPYLMRFDSNGVMKEKFSPFDYDSESGNSLPRVLAKRRPNRGMEGLAITPDGKTLVGVMQSSLYNPDNSVKKSSRIVRILAFDLETSTSRQYAYVQEAPGLALSGIFALSNEKFLVIERDNDYPIGDPSATAGVNTTISQIKSVVEIDISEATDITDPKRSENGLTFRGKTIEQLDGADGLASVGIAPVKKRLFYDLLNCEIPYIHDKVEGLAYFPKDSLLVIVNDNDFAIDSDGTEVFQKLNRWGELERTELYFVKVK